MSFTGERLHEGDALFGVDLLRHRAPYAHAIGLAGRGRVLDLGCGGGYGTAELAGALEAMSMNEVAPESYWANVPEADRPAPGTSVSLISTELLQSVKDKGIKVYTIAFTEASDVELLRQVASETGALFKLARSDQDLHEVFSAIFESAKAPDMLPIEGGEFVVDESIDEVTIVASKEREDVRIFLQAPDGRELSSDDAGDTLKWFVSHHFDMITVTKPQTGGWKLLFSAGNNRAYIVTNMSLNHNPQQPNLKTNEDMVLESWLAQDGKLLDREAVLTNTRFFMDIQDPAGNSAHVDLLDAGQYGDRKAADGVYANTLSYANPGAYRIQIVAQGETFQRQKTVHLEVAAAAAGGEPPVPAVPQPDPAPEPVSEPPPAPQAGPEMVDPPVQPAAEQETQPGPPPAETQKSLSLGLALAVALPGDHRSLFRRAGQPAVSLSTALVLPGHRQLHRLVASDAQLPPPHDRQSGQHDHQRRLSGGSHGLRRRLRLLRRQSGRTADQQDAAARTLRHGRARVQRGSRPGRRRWWRHVNRGVGIPTPIGGVAPCRRSIPPGIMAPWRRFSLWTTNMPFEPPFPAYWTGRDTKPAPLPHSPPRGVRSNPVHRLTWPWWISASPTGRARSSSAGSGRGGCPPRP